MKYLFIVLNTQDGEREHTSRSLLQIADTEDIEESAELYASEYWCGKSEPIDENGYYWVSGEFAVRLSFVREITKSEYKLLSALNSGCEAVVREEQNKDQIAALRQLKEYSSNELVVDGNFSYNIDEKISELTLK